MSILRYNSRGVLVIEAQKLINDYFARKSDGITEHEIARAVESVPAVSGIRERLRKQVNRIIANGWKVAVDGDFGDQTDAAVRLVQCNEDGLSIDGAIGPMTRARLEQRSIEPVELEDPAKNGLLINGKIVPVPGFKVIGPHDAAWSHLAPGDAQKRRRNPDGTLRHWVRQYIVHKTLAAHPEELLEGKGPPGMARRTAEYWQRDPRYGGAHLVFGDDGEIACLADLVNVEAFHATRSNPWSIGSEMREVHPRGGEKIGRFYRATLDANTATVITTCRTVGIQMQSHGGPYRNRPLARMDDDGATPGGPDCVGVFDHKLNTDQRGMWDAGNLWLEELRKAVPGYELFDFEKGEDKAAWRDRQSDLVRAGHKLQITGVPGPETVAALKLEGYVDGIWALGKAA